MGSPRADIRVKAVFSRSRISTMGVPGHDLNSARMYARRCTGGCVPCRLRGTNSSIGTTCKSATLSPRKSHPYSTSFWRENIPPWQVSQVALGAPRQPPDLRRIAVFLRRQKALRSISPMRVGIRRNLPKLMHLQRDSAGAN
jgi:hypothetical protein